MATFWILLVVVVVVGGVLELFPGYNEVVADIADLSFPTRILSSGVSAVGMAGCTDLDLVPWPFQPVLP